MLSFAQVTPSALTCAHAPVWFCIFYSNLNQSSHCLFTVCLPLHHHFSGFTEFR